MFPVCLLFMFRHSLLIHSKVIIILLFKSLLFLATLLLSCFAYYETRYFLRLQLDNSVYGAVLTFQYSVYGAIYSVYGAIYGVQTPYTEPPYMAPYTAILGLNTEFSVSVYGAVLTFQYSVYGAFTPYTELFIPYMAPYMEPYMAPYTE